jgi:protein subunit release factor A
MAVDVTELEVFAQKRATQIRNYLIQQEKISDERVVAVWAKIDDVAKGDTVHTILTLAGS